MILTFNIFSKIIQVFSYRWFLYKTFLSLFFVYHTVFRIRIQKEWFEYNSVTYSIRHRSFFCLKLREASFRVSLECVLNNKTDFYTKPFWFGRLLMLTFFLYLLYTKDHKIYIFKIKNMSVSNSSGIPENVLKTSQTF